MKGSDNTPLSGLEYGSREETVGGVTTGEHYVQLEDGRTMTVRYTVDGDGGYNPEISFSDGETPAKI